VNDASPLLSVMLEPVNPVLGPETTLNNTVRPTTGVSGPTTNIVAVTVCDAPTGFVSDTGAKVMPSMPKPMVLLSKVTAPLSANNLPPTNAPVVTVIDEKARMFPTKAEFVPIVAELPITQKTLLAWAPLIRTTLLPEAVVSVDAAWKIKTELESPPPSRVKVPVIPNVPAAVL